MKASRDCSQRHRRNGDRISEPRSIFTSFSEEQIVGILNEAESGIPVTEVCRNRRLKQMVTQQALDIQMLDAVNRRKW